MVVILGVLLTFSAAFLHKEVSYMHGASIVNLKTRCGMCFQMKGFESMNVEGQNDRALAIDASRCRSGGGVAHLNGILRAVAAPSHGFVRVHLWAPQSLLEVLPDRDWLIKHTNAYINGSMISQLFWQKFLFASEFGEQRCSIVLNVDAATLSRVKPAVTMSRDMLSYEPGEMERYPIGLFKLRLYVLKFVQNAALRRADGAVFLTNYARNMIVKTCGHLTRSAIINHGVSEIFRKKRFVRPRFGQIVIQDFICFKC